MIFSELLDFWQKRSAHLPWLQAQPWFRGPVMPTVPINRMALVAEKGCLLSYVFAKEVRRLLYSRMPSISSKSILRAGIYIYYMYNVCVHLNIILNDNMLVFYTYIICVTWVSYVASRNFYPRAYTI